MHISRCCFLTLLGLILLGVTSLRAPAASVTFKPYNDPWTLALERWWDIGSYRSGSTDRYNQFNDWISSGAPNGKFQYSVNPQVTLTYDAAPGVPYFVGHIHATGLKPNFAYQLKLTGKPISGNRGMGTAMSYVTASSNLASGTPVLHPVYDANNNLLPVNGDDWTNQQLGYAGRWWDDTNPPSTNFTDSYYRANYPVDTIYGYLFMGVFVTDQAGSCDVDFTGQNSFHITRQDWELGSTSGYAQAAGSPFTISGLMDSSNPTHYYGYGPNPPASGNTQENGHSQVSLYYEYEPGRAQPVSLPNGTYHCRFLLTEESFHNLYGTTNGTLGGRWKTVLTTEDFDAGGQPDTNPANDVVFTIGAPTVITTQPSAQAVCSGAPASFSVVATGAGTLTYQWRKGTTPLSNGGNVSGATTSNLTLNPATAGDVAANYNVVVTGATGSVTSNNAAFTVNPATLITTQPGSQIVVPGGSANFSVAATGTGTLTYQWRKGTTLLSNGGNVSGAATPTLTINPATGGDAATNYNVVVTGDCGSVTSNDAGLAINTAPVADAQSVSTPTNTAKTIPLGAHDADGDTLTFAIVALPGHGTLGAVTSNQVTYTPADGYTGPDSFSFKATDSHGADSNVALVSITVVAPPAITSLAPGSGAPGATITINGSHFSGASAVQFNGLDATFIGVSDTKITATVPANALTGPLTVTTPGGTATSATNFTVAPRITSFTPASGPVSTPVTINGFNFASASVKFNGFVASMQSRTATSIVALVPASATTGPLTVTNAGGTASANFTVIPRITGFTPASGPVGTTVTINGNTFTGAGTVRFNGVAVPGSDFTVVSATRITAKVPDGATTGKISVINGFGDICVSASDFKVLPTISGFAPGHGFAPLNGAPGTAVTITGNTFTGTTAVKFNGILAPGFTVDSDNQITVAVPAGATTGKISVTNAGGTTVSANIFTVAPRLTSFTPASGAAGTSVTITGANFTDTTAVTFNGTGASYQIVSATQIKVPVPEGATTGLIQVTNSFGDSVTSATPFKVLPLISGFAPTHGFATVNGAPGTVVTITGKGFTGATAVKFNNQSVGALVPDINAANAGYQIVSDTQLQARVPNGAYTGKISVSNASGTTLGTNVFAVAPRIASFTPTSGAAGIIVTINGANFLNAADVRFAGLSAGPLVLDINAVTQGYQIVSATQIKARVPTGATTGKISVVNGFGDSGASSANFVVTASIMSAGKAGAPSE